MWNPYEKLRSKLAETEDTEFVRIFIDGEEVDTIEDVPQRTRESRHVVAYSENHVFYRHYLPWTNGPPKISETTFNHNPREDININPMRKSGEMR